MNLGMISAEEREGTRLVFACLLWMKHNTRGRQGKNSTRILATFRVWRAYALSGNWERSHCQHSLVLGPVLVGLDCEGTTKG